MHIPHAHTGVGELTSECEAKIPFLSVVTQLPSLCFLSVVFCGVLGEALELLCDLRDHIFMEMRGPPS